MTKKKPDEEAFEEEQEEKSQRRASLLKTLLLYPTLAIAIIGAVPGYCGAVESFLMKVPFGRAEEAKEQSALWQRNRKCLSELREEDYLRTISKDSTVSIALCKSTGDVLIEIQSISNPEHSIAKWISQSTLVAQPTSFDLIAPNLYAQTFQERQILQQQRLLKQTICLVSDDRTVKLVETPVGCFLKVINHYTGQTITQSISCKVSCSNVTDHFIR